MGSTSASLRIRKACCSLPKEEKSQLLYILLISSASQYGIPKCFPSLSPNQVLPEPGNPIIKTFKALNPVPLYTALAFYFSVYLFLNQHLIHRYTYLVTSSYLRYSLRYHQIHFQHLDQRSLQ
jgi:hypothetical protein